MKGKRVQRLWACALAVLFVLNGSAAAQQTQTSIALDALIAEALERNPELSVLRRGFDARRARVPQAKALPEPMLNVSST